MLHIHYYTYYIYTGLKDSVYRSQQTIACRPNPTSLFLQIKFYRNTVTNTVYGFSCLLLPTSAFTPQQQSWVVGIENARSNVPQIFTICLYNKFATLWFTLKLLIVVISASWDNKWFFFQRNLYFLQTFYLLIWQNFLKLLHVNCV